MLVNLPKRFSRDGFSKSFLSLAVWISLVPSTIIKIAAGGSEAPFSALILSYLMLNYKKNYVALFILLYFTLHYSKPVVPHKAVVEVSKIGNL